MSSSKSVAGSLKLLVTDVHGGDYSVGDELTLQTLNEIRHLPDRRKVWHAQYRGQELLLKVFFPHRKQIRDVDREWNSSLLLAKNHVLVPKPLAKAKNNEGDIAVIFEFIPEARELDDVIKTGSPTVVTEWLRQLADIHGRQHELGAFQNDDHLSNYLWSNDKLYVIDTGSILIKKAPLAESYRVENMAKLLANTPYLLRDQMLRAIRESGLYGSSITNRENHFRMIDDLIPKEISKRMARYIRKTRRTSEEFIHQIDPDQEWHAWRDMDLAVQDEFIANPESFSDSSYGKVYEIKSYPKVSALARWLGGSRYSQVLNEWSLGQVLLNFEIPAARPLACITGRKNADSDFLLMVKVEGLALAELSSAELLDTDASVARQLATRLMQLADVGVSYQETDGADFILDQIGVLRIANMRNLSIKAVSTPQDPLSFTANELIPDHADEKTKAAFLKVMETEISREM